MHLIVNEHESEPCPKNEFDVFQFVKQQDDCHEEIKEQFNLQGPVGRINIFDMNYPANHRYVNQAINKIRVSIFIQGENSHHQKSDDKAKPVRRKQPDESFYQKFLWRMNFLNRVVNHKSANDKKKLNAIKPVFKNVGRKNKRVKLRTVNRAIVI